MEKLKELAELLKKRNEIDSAISSVIGRPAISGHFGEFIAAKIFDIQLAESATNKGTDGHFKNEPLAGRTVNIKLYGKQEGILDINPAALPDFYLVLTGPRSAAISSKGKHRPCVIDHAYLFDASELVKKLMHLGRKIGVATSVRKEFWESAELYPVCRSEHALLLEEKCSVLLLFGSESSV